MALRLQQEMTDKETQLEQAYSRLDTGEAPDEESAKEWMKMVRAAEMRNSQDFSVSIHACCITYMYILC